MNYKELFGAIAIVLTFFAYYPYIRAILIGRVKPHVFSWIIWGFTTLSVFFAQLQDAAGIGAWPIGISGVVTIGIAILAYFKKTDVSITKTDWFFFMAALSALPFWYLTSDPLWAVIILTTVDLFGFFPTFRKAYHLPHEEHVPFFLIFMIRIIISIMALENYSLTTVLFPAVISVGCLLLIIVVIYRRRVLARQ